jgi:hypothetical protein
VLVGWTDGHGTSETVASAATTTVANVNDAPTARSPSPARRNKARRCA